MDISKLTISQIKKIADSPAGAGLAFRLALSEDSRVGVREIYRKLLHNENVMEREMKRLAKMFLYEKDLKARGRHPVAGVDEAGRGPLAGPVVAAAVILPDSALLVNLNDSKKLAPTKREYLAGQIERTALAWSIGVSSVEEIFSENIHQAGLKAMRRAVAGLAVKPAHVLVDGFKIDRLAYPQTPIIAGDGLSASIAAASILAKVIRDRLMNSYHKLYPQYGFDRHKGYGTAEHLQALSAYGPCPIHRTGYRPVQECLQR
ncbi:MAG: ribonuclease HII [Desulfotomaculaceae bacterium]|nr:ribonuclease HII [Desulfotomaculaceae bacterium]MDD4767968.1 ribonuclease HII [Desulfotomaculaceae bacterium]